MTPKPSSASSGRTHRKMPSLFRPLAQAVGNVGFVNADGNAVFYSKARPTNIYDGLKGKDIQVEVFDPLVDQALGLVLVRNQVRQIS
jgi:hypothetical protein